MVWKLAVALLVVLLGRGKKCAENELANGIRRTWDEYRRLPWCDKI